MIHAPPTPLMLGTADRIFRAPSFTGLAGNPWARLAPASVMLAPLDWLADISSDSDRTASSEQLLDFTTIECRLASSDGAAFIRMTSPACRSHVKHLRGMGFSHLAAVAVLVSMDAECTVPGELRMIHDWIEGSSTAAVTRALPCPLPAADIKKACETTRSPIFPVARIRIVESSGEHLLFRAT